MPYETDTREDSAAVTEPLDDDELQAIVAQEIEAARAWGETYLQEPRVAAMRAYKGAPYGNEKEGRSKVVTRELRDTVRAIMPSMLRIFCGGERAVEYTAQQEEDAALAEQLTDYVNHVVLGIDNPGFLLFHSWFKDAFLQSPAGIVKWYWEDEPIVLTEVEYEGMDLPTWAELLSSEDVEEVESFIDEDTGLIDGRIRRVKPHGRIRIKVIPAEEIGFGEHDTDLDNARLIYHQREITAAEAVAMGYDYEEIEEFLGMDGEFVMSTPEAFERNPQDVEPGASGTFMDAGSKTMLYTEALFRIDTDGDGRAELRKICCAGPNYSILSNTVTDEVPYAFLSPDPESHSLIGTNFADILSDIQYLNTHLWRGMLDSLGFSLFPRTVVLEGMVRMEDVLDQQVGQTIRARVPGAVQELNHTFNGLSILPVMEQLKALRQERTGITDISAGTGPEILQSTTKAAVNAAVTAGQAQVEVLARIFAETGVKRLFAGILHTLAKHPTAVQNRTVRLRNTWVKLDPRIWDARMDVQVNVALGGGLPEDRRIFMERVLEKQEAILEKLGPSNPLVSLKEYRHTLGKLLEMSGEKNASAFFKEIPPDWEPPPPPEPEPDPAGILAQAEMQKAQNQAQEQQARLQLDQLKIMLEDDRARDKMRIEARIAAAKMGQAMDMALIDHMVSRVEKIETPMGQQQEPQQ